MRCSKLCTIDSNPDGEVLVGSPDKSRFLLSFPSKAVDTPLACHATLIEQYTNNRKSVPATSLSAKSPSQSRELPLARRTRAQNYEPEIYSQANPSRAVAEKMRKRKREKRKLFREHK